VRITYTDNFSSVNFVFVADVANARLSFSTSTLVVVVLLPAVVAVAVVVAGAVLLAGAAWSPGKTKKSD
jgi:hypothetical protein